MAEGEFHTFGYLDYQAKHELVELVFIPLHSTYQENQYVRRAYNKIGMVVIFLIKNCSQVA